MRFERIIAGKSAGLQRADQAKNQKLNEPHKIALPQAELDLHSLVSAAAKIVVGIAEMRTFGAFAEPCKPS